MPNRPGSTCLIYLLTQPVEFFSRPCRQKLRYRLRGRCSRRQTGDFKLFLIGTAWMPDRDGLLLLPDTLCAGAPCCFPRLGFRWRGLGGLQVGCGWSPCYSPVRLSAGAALVISRMCRKIRQLLYCTRRATLTKLDALNLTN
jgi:hypothetical protein